MLPHQERVVIDKQELDDKLSKLEGFISGPVFPTIDQEEQSRLAEQLGYMTKYSDVLKRRIEAFPVAV